METTTMDVHVAESHFKEVMLLVNKGTLVVLQDGDKDVARVVPAGPRIPGLHLGAIKETEDFDDPLPDEFWGVGK